MENRGTDLNKLQPMKQVVEHEEGYPLPNRRGPSQYDQLVSDFLSLTDKKSMFFATPQAKKELTNYRNWVKGMAALQTKFNYYAQVGYSKDHKNIGIRTWCLLAKPDDVEKPGKKNDGGKTAKAPRKNAAKKK